MKRLCVKLFAMLGVLLVSANALALEVEAEGGDVVAKTDDGRTWRHTILDKENFPDRSVHVLEHHNHVYACGEGMIYQLDGYNGSVHWRRLLPYKCSALEVVEDSVKVTVLDDHNWEGKKTERTYEVTTSGVNMPFVLGHGLSSRLPMRQADALLDKSLFDLLEKSAQGTEVDLTSESQAAAEKAIDTLGRAAAADPTNPWMRFRRGQVYQLLGKSEAARASYESVFKIAKPYHPELLLLAKEFDGIDSKLGERAFDLAMTSLLEAGFEPNLNTSLISVMLWLGRPPGSDDKVYDPSNPEDLAVLERRGMRLAQFAPRSEGATHFFNALFEAAQKRGDAQSAAKWKQLRDDAYPYRVFGGPARDAAATGDWLNVYLACGVVFWLLLLVKLARSGFDRVPPDSSKLVRWNLFNRLTRGELAGMFGVIAVGLYALRKTTTGVAIIGVMASMPIGAFSGSLGHPDTQTFFERYSKESNERTLVLGIAAQQRGEFEAATALYSKIPNSPHAVNNLGVIAKQTGKEQEAKKQWEKALSLDSDLATAKYNLGQEVEGIRFDQQKKYAPGLPLLATPTQDHWSTLWKSTAELDAWVNPMSVFRLADTVSPDGESALMSWLSAAPAMLFALFMLAFMLVGLVKRDEITAHEQKRSLPGWALSMLIPGASRHWSAAGPLFALLFFTAALAAYMLSNSQGMATNVLMAIAIPSFHKYFGISEYYHGADEALWRQLASYWWVLLVANLVFVGAMEKLRPDPNGPFAGKEK